MPRNDGWNCKLDATAAQLMGSDKTITLLSFDSACTANKHPGWDPLLISKTFWTITGALLLRVCDFNCFPHARSTLVLKLVRFVKESYCTRIDLKINYTEIWQLNSIITIVKSNSLCIKDISVDSCTPALIFIDFWFLWS